MTLTKIKTRYTLLDAIRGLAVICMVAYHLMWDLCYIYGVNMPWFSGDAMRIFQRAIRWTFILLSGFCFPLGSRQWKRGLVILGCSVVITLGSLIAVPETPIFFGVLTLLGSSMLLTVPVHKLTNKWNPYIVLTVAVLLFALTCRLPDGYVLHYAVPRECYANYFTAFLGMPQRGFYSSDYVPLIPWFFAYLMGYGLYGVFAKYNWLKIFKAFRIPPLEFVGRHALLIYMLHQPLVYGLLWVIFYFI